ncbi:hypothetical protein DZJ_23340 [Dickeya ananatis]
MIDSKGAAGVMVELVVLAATENVVGVIKPILPDVREFMRGTVRLMSRLLALKAYGIQIPDIKILANCVENTTLDRKTLEELGKIVSEKQYLQSDNINISILETKIDQLEVYKRGHAFGQPVHRLEYETDRKSPAAAVTIHSLACELFPGWKERFDSVLRNRTGAEEVGNA